MRAYTDGQIDGRRPKYGGYGLGLVVFWLKYARARSRTYTARAEGALARAHGRSGDALRCQRCFVHPYIRTSIHISIYPSIHLRSYTSIH